MNKKEFFRQWNDAKKDDKREVVNVMLKNGGNIWTVECYPESFPDTRVGFMSNGHKKQNANHILISIPYSAIHAVLSCAHWR